MVQQLKCVKKIGRLGDAYICIQCEKDDNSDISEFKEVIRGFCKECIGKFKLDSIKGGIWDLGI